MPHQWVWGPPLFDCGSDCYGGGHKSSSWQIWIWDWSSMCCAVSPGEELIRSDMKMQALKCLRCTEVNNIMEKNVIKINGDPGSSGPVMFKFCLSQVLGKETESGKAENRMHIVWKPPYSNFGNVHGLTSSEGLHAPLWVEQILQPLGVMKPRFETLLDKFKNAWWSISKTILLF